MKVKEGGAVK